MLAEDNYHCSNVMILRGKLDEMMSAQGGGNVVIFTELTVVYDCHILRYSEKHFIACYPVKEKTAHNYNQDGAQPI